MSKKINLMDLFFETEEFEEEVIEEGELKPLKKEVKKETSTIKAKDVMYQTPEKKTSAFIHIDEEPVLDIHNEKVTPTSGTTDDGYELQQCISPMFGVVESKYKDVESKTITPINKAKMPTSPLGTVISPIYGDMVDEKETVDEKIEEVVLESEVVDDFVVPELPAYEDIFSDEDEYYDDSSLDNLLESSDETYVVDEEISLFDPED